MIRRSVIPSSGCISPRGVEGAMLLRNVGNYLPVATASHLRRLKYSAAPLWEPQTKCVYFVYLYAVYILIADWLCQQYVVSAVNKSGDQWRMTSENISTWSGTTIFWNSTTLHPGQLPDHEHSGCSGFHCRCICVPTFIYVYTILIHIPFIYICYVCLNVKRPFDGTTKSQL
jgi:hypothetical protein